MQESIWCEVMGFDRAGMVEVVASSGGFMHGHTYQTNPMACAVGFAAVTETIERDLAGNAQRMGELLRSRLEALAANSAIIGDVRGRGLLFALELVSNKSIKAMIPTETPAPARFQTLALDQDMAVYCRRTNRGLDGDWVMVSPALIATAVQIDEIVDGLAKTVRAYEAELTRDGVKLG